MMEIASAIIVNTNYLWNTKNGKNIIRKKKTFWFIKCVIYFHWNYYFCFSHRIRIYYFGRYFVFFQWESLSCLICLFVDMLYANYLPYIHYATKKFLNLLCIRENVMFQFVSFYRFLIFLFKQYISFFFLVLILLSAAYFIFRLPSFMSRATLNFTKMYTSRPSCRFVKANQESRAMNEHIYEEMKKVLLSFLLVDIRYCDHDPLRFFFAVLSHPLSCHSLRLDTHKKKEAKKHLDTFILIINTTHIDWEIIIGKMLRSNCGLL